MNSSLVDVLSKAHLDVALAAKEGKLGKITRLPSLEALKSALGASSDVNNVCNGMCDDPVDIVKEKFTHVISSDFKFERLSPLLIEDRACNNVCNGMCSEPLDLAINQVTLQQ